MQAYGWLLINAQSAYVLDMLLVTLNTKRTTFLLCWYQITFSVTMSVLSNGLPFANGDYSLLPLRNNDSPLPLTDSYSPTLLCLDMSRCRACLFPIERREEDVLAGNWSPSYILLFTKLYNSHTR